jgi:ATP-binding protein involved in chromosome partitioning
MQTTGHRHGPAQSASVQSSAAPEKLPGIKHMIAVGSGKGGVGKSTVSVNLALALRQTGGRIGLVDADVLGPSIPVMLGLPVGQPPAMTPDGRIIPAERYGLKVVSMGMLTGDDSPAILRGPMVSKYLRMFIDDVQWGQLDYLILDLAPGTGDTQLTLAQSFPLSGAVIVTTPQEVSLKIARRGLRMFETVHVPILGIVENMSTFICPHCGEGTSVFGHGGGERMSRQLGVAFLGGIPLDAEIVASGDEGRPIVIDKPNSFAAQAYLRISTAIADLVEGQARPAALQPFAWTWETGEGEPAWLESAVQPSGSRTTAVGFRRRDPRTLSVLWQDGHPSDFDVRGLRLACRCALCVEEMSGQPLLDPRSVRPDVLPRTIASVGNYAITINWNDGHSTGIYSFDYLRALGELSAAGIVEDV